MAEQTTNLGLTKPDAAEGYDINVFNGNADIVDGAVGALLNELGGAGGGLGDKVDALQQSMTAARSEIAAVKTATDRIGSTADASGAATIYGQIKALATALASANQSIATMLTQRAGVKTVYNGTAYTSQTSGIYTFTIPETMNANKCIVYVGQGITWSKNGATVTLSAAATGQSFTFQIIEFY